MVGFGLLALVLLARTDGQGDKMSLVRAVASLELYPSADVKNKTQGWDQRPIRPSGPPLA